VVAVVPVRRRLLRRQKNIRLPKRMFVIVESIRRCHRTCSFVRGDLKRQRKGSVVDARTGSRCEDRILLCPAPHRKAHLNERSMFLDTSGYDASAMIFQEQFHQKEARIEGRT